MDRPAPEEPSPDYLVWKDGPAALVIEVGSKSIFWADEGPKVEQLLPDAEGFAALVDRERGRAEREKSRAGDMEEELSRLRAGLRRIDPD